MPTELLATCWTHAGDALPVAGRRLSPLDLRARAEAVAAAGFTGIGFTIDDLEAGQATYGLAQLGRICDDLGLVHREVELLEDWWTTGGRRRRSDQTRGSLLSAADVLGARQIKIGPDVQVVDGAVPPLSDLDHWAEELHRLAGQAAEVGTRVALEPLPFSNITDFRVAAELVAAADHSAAGLVVDIWHLERGPSTLADLARIPGDRVFVVELNDAPGPQSTDLFHDTIHHRTLCGSGTFDLGGFVETLQRIGFPGPWSVEILSDAHRRRPVQQALVDAHRTTMALFDSPSPPGPGTVTRPSSRPSPARSASGGEGIPPG
jgi:sugar phosphate isomerase/epimerase